MAIPFIMPEDEDVGAEDLIRKIEVHFSRHISQIQPENRYYINQHVLTGQNRSDNIQINITHRSTDHNNNNINLSTSIASWLRSYRCCRTESSTNGRAIASISRRRTTSESSCCEETKISIMPLESNNNNTRTDWTQVGQILREIADDFEHIQINQKSDIDDQTIPESQRTCPKDSLLSRLVPDSFSSSIWTAIPVICAVGWHLLKPR